MPSILAKSMDIPSVPFYMRHLLVLPTLFSYGATQPFFQHLITPPAVSKPSDSPSGTFSFGPFSFLSSVFGKGQILPFFRRVAVPSRPVDVSSTSNFFSRFPVRISKGVAFVEDATQYIIQGCTAAGSKERKQAMYRHSNPCGNVYVLCHSECDVERLMLFAKVIELLWINDDVTEELPHADALDEHNIFRQALDPHQDADANTGMTIGAKKQYLRGVRDQMLALDPHDTPAVLDSIDKFLREHDRDSKEFATMAEYLPFRNSNVGYGLVSHLTAWAMNLHVTAEEYDSIRDLKRTLCEVTALTNDYFSWKMEKLLSTDRIRNGVHVLMKEHGLPQEEAKALLKGFIVDMEEKVQRLRKEREVNGPPMSGDLKRYVDALELYAGGNCYWSATCPRYNDPLESQENGC